MKEILLLIILSLAYCKTNNEMMEDFVKCAKDQVGKKYLEELNSRGPSVFSNAGLIWYCRDVAEMPKATTIYVSWKTVPSPKIGAYIYGVIKDYGPYVSGEQLGIIVSLNPTMVVAGDPEKGVLTKQVFQPRKQYQRIEYLYVDF